MVFSDRREWDLFIVFLELFVSVEFWKTDSTWLDFQVPWSLCTMNVKTQGSEVGTLRSHRANALWTCDLSKSVVVGNNEDVCPSLHHCCLRDFQFWFPEHNFSIFKIYPLHFWEIMLYTLKLRFLPIEFRFRPLKIYTKNMAFSNFEIQKVLKKTKPNK